MKWNETKAKVGDLAMEREKQLLIRVLTEQNTRQVKGGYIIIII